MAEQRAMTVRMDAELYERIRVRAAQDGTSMSRWVRGRLAAGVDAEPPRRAYAALIPERVARWVEGRVGDYPGASLEEALGDIVLHSLERDLREEDGRAGGLAEALQASRRP